MCVEIFLFRRIKIMWVLKFNSFEALSKITLVCYYNCHRLKPCFLSLAYCRWTFIPGSKRITWPCYKFFWEWHFEYCDPPLVLTICCYANCCNFFIFLTSKEDKWIWDISIGQLDIAKLFEIWGLIMS